jgi:hypothetical protein
MRSGDASFTRSYGPCTSSSLHTMWSNPHGGEAFESASGLGKPARVGKTSTGAEANGRSAARRVSPLPKEEGVARQKRKEVEASVPARTRELGFGCPHVDRYVAEVGRRRLVSISSANALRKERPGSSERGPSAGQTLTDETGSGCLERNDASRVGLTG